mmetsp:Transcript_28610/g.72806  ORF Transcript_28610/g.72806 Transcript_28610/m.72806 type:complete len:254 (-) Transcript_28610:1514-2275(-)
MLRALASSSGLDSCASVCVGGSSCSLPRLRSMTVAGSCGLLSAGSYSASITCSMPSDAATCCSCALSATHCLRITSHMARRMTLLVPAALSCASCDVDRSMRQGASPLSTPALLSADSSWRVRGWSLSGRPRDGAGPRDARSLCCCRGLGSFAASGGRLLASLCNTGPYRATTGVSGPSTGTSTAPALAWAAASCCRGTPSLAVPGACWDGCCGAASCGGAQPGCEPAAPCSSGPCPGGCTSTSASGMACAGG